MVVQSSPLNQGINNQFILITIYIDKIRYNQNQSDRNNVKFPYFIKYFLSAPADYLNKVRTIFHTENAKLS